MKKLMVVLAAVAMAACANAASVSWTSGAVKDHTGTTIADKSTAYLATLYLYDDQGNDVSSTFTTGSLVQDKSSKGVYKNTAGGPSGTYQAQLVITDGEWTFTSGMVEFTYDNTQYSDLPVSIKDLGGMAANTSDTPNYGWQSVPEPTSGLLLLLGVAGLALRRRRA